MVLLMIKEVICSPACMVSDVVAGLGYREMLLPAVVNGFTAEGSFSYMVSGVAVLG